MGCKIVFPKMPLMPSLLFKPMLHLAAAHLHLSPPFFYGSFFGLPAEAAFSFTTLSVFPNVL